MSGTIRDPTNIQDLPSYARHALREPEREWSPERKRATALLRQVHRCYAAIFNPEIERWEVWVADVEGRSDTWFLKARVTDGQGRYAPVDDRTFCRIAMFDLDRGMDLDEFKKHLLKGQEMMVRDRMERDALFRQMVEEAAMSLAADPVALSRIGAPRFHVPANLA